MAYRPRSWPEYKAQITRFYDCHQSLLALLVLFVSFRALTILLLRPGGFIVDNSDYEFYYSLGSMGPRGYYPGRDLVTAYPPIFPSLVMAVYELAARLPPWTEPRLAFHGLLGGVLLLFETGNFLLIAHIAARLETDPAGRPHATPGDALSGPLRAPILYTLFFAPVYALLGFFESMPLFFLLLALDALLYARGRWPLYAGSAVAAGLGFLTKFTPALVVPLVLHWSIPDLNDALARHSPFRPPTRRQFMLILTYALAFGLTVGAVVSLFALYTNPALLTSSLRALSNRPPWQSVWALLDGYHSYGLLPLDGRNVTGLSETLWATRLPWGWITAATATLYLWLYTRPFDWRRPRTLVAFTAASLVLLLLYNKGWSPQFLVWILVFIALLAPTLPGVLVAAVLTGIDLVESFIYMLLIPEQQWILYGTVILRTTLLALVGGLFLAQIWPTAATRRRLTQSCQALLLGVALLAVAGGLVATPRMLAAYTAKRLAQHPCAEALAVFAEQSAWPARTIVTPEIELWQQLYPWLREHYRLIVLDDYSPEGDPGHAAALRLEEIMRAAPGEFWWVERDPGAAALANDYFARPDVQRIETQELGVCRVSRVVERPAQPLATANVRGGEIMLYRAELGQAGAGAPLHLVLFWMGSAPLAESDTVFTQLLDGGGQLVAQQDNVPVMGLAPTNTWQPGRMIRDPYRLALPAGLPPGAYRLLIGLYTPEGRRILRLADGAQADHLALTVTVR